MLVIESKKELRLIEKSFSILKKMNLKDIGFSKISGSNLYSYQSNEYKILNYSIKPKLIFLIKSEENYINIKLQKISIKNLPFIFKSLNVIIEVNIFPENNSCKLHRYISLRYETKNKLIKFISQNLINKFLKDLIETISIRFDKKLINKILKAI